MVRGDLKKANPIIVSLWLLVSIFVGYLLIVVWNAYQSEVDKVRLRTLAQTRLVAEHAASMFDRTNLVLVGVGESLAVGDLRVGTRLSLARRIEIQQMLARYQDRLPGVVGISLAMANGEVFSSSLDPTPNYRIDDRTYFQQLKRQSGNAPVISEAMKGRLRGKWGIFLAHRLTFADGSFAGALVANLGLHESFESFYKTVGVEPNMLITLRDPENRLLVRYPIEEGWFNTVVGNSLLTKAIRSGEVENVLLYVSPIDSVERFVAFRKLNGYPVYAAVGLSKGIALASWHQQLKVALLVIMAVVLAAAYSSYVILRKERVMFDLEHAHRELTSTHQQLDSFSQKLEVSNAKLADSLALAERNAYHDSLTGLPNRLLVRQRFAEAVEQARATGQRVGLMFIDLDNFKNINDSLGHVFGDQVLKAVAARISSLICPSNTLSRQGGDEFLLVVGGLADDQALMPLLDSLMDELQKPMTIGDEPLSISVSTGTAFYPDDGDDFDTLLKKADTAMYRAKAAGRNTYRFFDVSMLKDADDRLRIRNGLRLALERQEFRLHYQPQVDLASGRIIGFEALIRWQHPELGMVPPCRFITVAEECGLIVPMGAWVLQEACRQLVAWQEQGHRAFVVAVNLSAVQFLRGDLEKTISDTLAQSGLHPDCLELELTESILIQDTDTILGTVNRLGALGVKMSIDDFGTGYSSLSYLKRFSVDKLKIDQSFVRALADAPEDDAIVRAIIQMAGSLGLKTIAEGVETAQVSDLLQGLGCDEVQGYHYARPMPADQILPFIQVFHSKRSGTLVSEESGSFSFHSI